MSPIRVVIVDDHPMVRRGLRSLLSMYSDIAVVADFDNGASTLESASTLLPDVILLDIKLPGMDGVALAKRLGEIVPNAKIIHLTAYEDDEYLQSSFRAGAYAYLLKTASDDTVVDTVRRVHAGERSLSPALINRVLVQFQSLAKSQTLHNVGLDGRDVEVLKLMAQGATNERIAQTLYWSGRTVKRHIEDICERLGTRNRTQAVAEAIKRGLI
jgi:DNA-binding NarL/FixJ family response regulator